MNIYILFEISKLMTTDNLLRFNVDEDPIVSTSVVRWYFYNKLLDWMDTFFICVRNKTNQLTFLHTSHHIIMVLLWYYAYNNISTIPLGCYYVQPLLNSIVHVILYLYYFVTSMDIHVSQTIKMNITRVQLIQFCICLYVGIKSYFVEQVNFHYFGANATILMSLYMLYLFGKLYIKQNWNDVSNKLYWLNLCMFSAFQIPVLVVGILTYPIFGNRVTNAMYNLSLRVLDYLFLQVKPLNTCTVRNGHMLLVNHSTSVDGYLRHFIPIQSVTVIKDSLFYIPFLGQIFWLLGFIFIQRDSPKSRDATRQKIAHQIKRNKIVQIFPQGTREPGKLFKTNDISLKRGCIAIALEADVPIVLIYHNTGDRIDDARQLIHFNKPVYAISSEPMRLPTEHANLPIDKQVDIMYGLIYQEFIRLEQRVLDECQK